MRSTALAITISDIFALSEGLSGCPAAADRHALVLQLQQRWLRPGAGSILGRIRATRLAPSCGFKPLLSRLVLWSIAAGCLLPIGREVGCVCWCERGLVDAPRPRDRSKPLGCQCF